jgi:hypothetical protein
VLKQAATRVPDREPEAQHKTRNGHDCETRLGCAIIINEYVELLESKLEMPDKEGLGVEAIRHPSSFPSRLSNIMFRNTISPISRSSLI